MKFSQNRRGIRIGLGLSLAVALGLSQRVQAAGFGLYEASSAAYALGGAVIGRAIDASANFYNPATLTDLTNVTVTAGLMLEAPRSRIKGYADSYGRMNSAKMCPGTFYLPHFHLAVPLGYDLTFGLGLMPEYGLGSQYNSTWDLRGNSQKTTVTSFTVNPNLAYKITDKWSVGAGLRWIFFDFEQEANPTINQQIPGLGTYSSRFDSRLKGDNGMRDFGWQVGTKYDLTDSFSVGLVYKSRTLVRVHGKNEVDRPADNTMGLGEKISAAATGDASTELMLPQSLTGGFNWDITDTWHLGGAVAWTEWSSVDTLRFDLPTGTKPIKLEWEDTWRFALAPSWDFAEDWTVLSSYVYETDCSGAQDSTMLPPSQRHMVSAGLVWRAWAGLEVSVVYGAILMDEGESRCTDNGVRYHYHAERGISHAAGVTLTYRF